MTDSPKNIASSPRLADILAPERNSFGLVRLIAALAVVVSHSVHLAGRPESAEPLAWLTGYSLGSHAVHAFFTISGVLIAASLVRSHSLLDYGRARALRLLPGVVVCVLATALLAGPLLSELPVLSYVSSGGLFKYLGVTLTLITANAPLPGLFVHNPVPDIVNLPLWTLKYESLCYGGLAILGVTGLIGSPRLTSYALAPPMLAWIVASAFPNWLPAEGAPESFLRLAFSFGLGTLAYVWRDRIVLHWWGVAAAFFVMALALGTRWEGPVEQVFVAYLVLWAASLPTGWLGAVTRRNDISYGVYIYDWPIAQAVLRLVPGLSQPLLLTATLGLLLPVAIASWRFVEKPMLALKRARVAEATTSGERVSLALREEPAAPSEPPARLAAPAPATAAAFAQDGPARVRLARIAGLIAPMTEAAAIPAGL